MIAHDPALTPPGWRGAPTVRPFTSRRAVRRGCLHIFDDSLGHRTDEPFET